MDVKFQIEKLKIDLSKQLKKLILLQKHVCFYLYREYSLHHRQC